MDINIDILRDDNNSYTHDPSLNLLKLDNGKIQLTLHNPERVVEVNGDQLLQSVTFLQNIK